MRPNNTLYPTSLLPRLRRSGRVAGERERSADRDERGLDASLEPARGLGP